MSFSDQNAKQVLYFDCYSGISGDMTLGALLDLGLDLDQLTALLSRLPLDGYRLEAEKVNRGGIAGTRARVIIDSQTQEARNLPAILKLIGDSDLPAAVKTLGSKAFQLLAEAEAAVHGITVEEVHFHEVGAVDAIIDIVGTAAALYLLGIGEIYCSPLPLGGGEVQAAHGRLPLPAPATVELLAGRKVPVRGSRENFELVTPTGAAIVAAAAKEFGPLPAFTVEAVGYGAGSYDPGYPNYLRLFMGYTDDPLPTQEETLLQIQANIDDLNPEIYGYLLQKLLGCGALDVFFLPVQMKKDRPGVLLTVLLSPDSLQAVREIIFQETSTLGFRAIPTRRIMRPRLSATVETEWGPICIKYCPSVTGEHILHYSPEYEDCCKVARKSGLPLKEIYRIAERLFSNKS
jgi:pyridinium-3,5-bisthiocarboxylic acid mononucleotide nickel chelatase